MDTSYLCRSLMQFLLANDKDKVEYALSQTDSPYIRMWKRSGSDVLYLYARDLEMMLIIKNLGVDINQVIPDINCFIVEQLIHSSPNACLNQFVPYDDLIQSGHLEDFCTPLHLSVKRYTPLQFKLLLQAGADPRVKDNFDNTPVALALSSQDSTFMHLLVDNNVDIMDEVHDVKQELRYGKLNAPSVVLAYMDKFWNFQTCLKHLEKSIPQTKGFNRIIREIIGSYYMDLTVNQIKSFHVSPSHIIACHFEELRSIDTKVVCQDNMQVINETVEGRKRHAEDDNEMDVGDEEEEENLEALRKRTKMMDMYDYTA